MSYAVEVKTLVECSNTSIYVHATVDSTFKLLFSKRYVTRIIWKFDLFSVPKTDDVCWSETKLFVWSPKSLNFNTYLYALVRMSSFVIFIKISIPRVAAEHYKSPKIFLRRLFSANNYCTEITSELATVDIVFCCTILRFEYNWSGNFNCISYHKRCVHFVHS